jgi:hypothetical protein
MKRNVSRDNKRLLIVWLSLMSTLEEAPNDVVLVPEFE